MSKKIEVSYRTLVLTLLFFVLVWFLYVIRDLIFQVFVALLITSTLNPTVTKLQRFRIPRVASVLIVYFFVVAFLVFAIVNLVPPLVEQSANFASSLPRYLEELKIPVFVVDEITKEVTSQIGKLPSQILKISVSIFSNIIDILMVLILALYFLLAREKIGDVFNHFLKKSESERAEKIIFRLEQRLGDWARAQLFLMALIGVATYVGLFALGIPFTLPLALLAGILEIVPNIGPIISAVPPIIIGFGISPLTGIAVAALYFLIQNLEAYWIVPKVMQRSAGINPIVTLLSLLVGFRVAGILGAILSIPVVIVAHVLLHEFVLDKKR